MLTLEKNKNLKSLNTLNFNACAEIFTDIFSETQLLETLEYIIDSDIRYQVMSGGSNLLMAENIPGLTMRMQIKGIDIVEQNDSQVTLRIGAGESWHDLVAYCVANQWQGIETMALIPGLVGAAPVQNIGAYGAEIQDVLVSVRAYDTQQAAFCSLSNQSCHFQYRDSLFKREPGRYIISAVDITLNKSANCTPKYKVLIDQVETCSEGYAKIEQVFNAVCDIRSAKLPNPNSVPNAGSFFKNPTVSFAEFTKIKLKHPDIVGHQTDTGEVKVAAGWMIERCGWKGYQGAGVGVYPKQALVLTHTGDSNLVELMALAEKIKVSVRTEFCITLEVEPQAFPA